MLNVPLSNNADLPTEIFERLFGGILLLKPLQWSHHGLALYLETPE
jgi:hypothetical protein